MKKILIVEDDTVSREALSDILGIEYEIDTACNGVEAQDKFVSFSPDLVIMDIMMPERDGYKAIRQLRAEEQKRGKAIMKILVTTALASEKLRDDLEKFDITYFFKPVDIRILKKVIKDKLQDA